MEPKFFASPDAFREWLESHHETERELWVGFYKKATGIPSITWPEAVDQALCFGWIDGVRKSLDADSYTNRFTPRKATSTWSEVNRKRVEELTALGLMRPAGIRAHKARTAANSGIYGYEQKVTELEEAYAAQLRANPTAWGFFQAQPPSYRRTASWWVMSAKQESTRLRRLATLIDDSANGRTIKPLTRPRTRN